MEEMKVVHRRPECRCGLCNNVIDSYSSIEGKEPPVENDLTVCLYCKCLARFDKNLNLVPLTAKEQEDLKKNDPKTYAKVIKIIKILI